MATKQAGDSFIYEYKDKSYLATVQNTFKDEDNNEMATISLSGTDTVIVVDNDF